ncbi:cysteine--tRNA ligase [Candidatus Parcubacteria bacterium]|jgi:cysteinyl-tRNA synthetase|nr:cysteine--tRNA ligase [Candidatus Parcubacteria bacterium]
MKIELYNSLSKKKEEFVPIQKNKVGMYTCGPTVYDYPHIGNLLAYTIWDVLKKFLLSQGYKVTHIMNFTDVGHLTSDADEGEDKLEKAGRSTGRSAWEIAEFFIKVFKNNLYQLNIAEPTKFLRATDTVEEQIAFTKILWDKGFLYKTKDGLYFDTSKIDNYGKLANLDKVEQQEGARVTKNPEKKNLTDFAVWKYSPEDKKRDMEWDSPWGLGFPGWHLECSVMSQMTLGDTFDIHTGGMDLMTVHHPNEMAGSEAVTGKQQANYWMHNAYVKLDGGKMSKSKGTYVKLEDIKEKGFSTKAFRLLVLQNHYRKSLNFSWQSIEAANKALHNIVREISFYEKPKGNCDKFSDEFYSALADDLNTAKALAVIQKILDADCSDSAKLNTIFKIDEILGLDLESLRDRALELSSEIKIILDKRVEARKAKDWKESDRLRDKLTALGVEVQDTSEGQRAVQVKL